MKGILETSFYLIVFTVISLMSLNFIIINKTVSDAGELGRYIENYIEVNGRGHFENSSFVLDRNVADRLESVADKSGMELWFSDAEVVGEKAYIDYKLTYRINTSVFGSPKVRTYEGMAGMYL